MKIMDHCQILLLGLLSCTGPRPDTSPARILAPSKSGEPYQVSLVVTNHGSGEGQVEVDVRLHEQKQGAIYFADKKLNLRGHESVHLRVDVDAPPGDYTAEVEIHYPPS